MEWLGMAWTIFKYVAFGVFSVTLIMILSLWFIVLLPSIRHKKSDVPLFGWRRWNIAKYDPYIDNFLELGLGLGYPFAYVLRGTTGKIWSAQTLSAKCLFHDHDSPQVRCRCGIYAIKVGPVLFRELESSMGYPFNVWGRVALSGEIVEHEEGYRASNAEVVEFVIVNESDVAGWNDVEIRKVLASFNVPISEYSYADFVREIEIGETVNGRNR